MLLEAHNLSKQYVVKHSFGQKQYINALNGVSLTLNARETLAVVGESGSGKTTLAKILIGLEKPTSGSALFEGEPLDKVVHRQRYIRMVFQNPYASLNPRWTIQETLAEPLLLSTTLSAKARHEKILMALTQVGLSMHHVKRYPHQFSGGQRQRIAIARALILEPKLIILDEPVSALDVSIQAQILNLLLDLQDAQGLSYLFISHDLSVVKHIADRVLVMYLGNVVEEGTADEVFGHPAHPYTQALLASTPHL